MSQKKFGKKILRDFHTSKKIFLKKKVSKLSQLWRPTLKKAFGMKINRKFGIDKIKISKKVMKKIKEGIFSMRIFIFKKEWEGNIFNRKKSQIFSIQSSLLNKIIDFSRRHSRKIKIHNK